MRKQLLPPNLDRALERLLFDYQHHHSEPERFERLTQYMRYLDNFRNRGYDVDKHYREVKKVIGELYGEKKASLDI